ncbi:MAG: hypothetical protein Q8P91_02490 [bacterium]|nr:hypothetical protein [bacterium]
MRKEVLYALLAGAFMGIIIAFGVWRANSAFKPNDNKTSENAPATTPPPQFGITVAKPDNLSVISENPTIISGITLAGSWVVISIKDNDYIIKSMEDGSFTREINLEGGINQLQISAIGPEGEVVVNKLTLVYSTGFSNSQTSSPEKAPPTPDGQGATEGSEIRQKVLEKVEEALKNPKALLGVVTDISISTLQIKIPSGEIQQMSILPDATIVKIDKVSKEVIFSDIAIGDFVVGMGYKNENNILEAGRVLITKQPDEFTVKATIGKMSSIDKAIISTDTYFSTYKNGKTIKTKISGISEDDLVIVVTEDIKGTTARTILVIE